MLGKVLFETFVIDVEVFFLPLHHRFFPYGRTMDACSLFFRTCELVGSRIRGFFDQNEHCYHFGHFRPRFANYGMTVGNKLACFMRNLGNESGDLHDLGVESLEILPGFCGSLDLRLGVPFLRIPHRPKHRDLGFEILFVLVSVFGCRGGFYGHVNCSSCGGKERSLTLGREPRD